MGWLWGSSKSEDGDPFRDLDPELKLYLQKESPVKYKPATPPPPPPTPGTETRTTEAATPKAGEDESKVPCESLFQDGRYAHLWKNYKPLREVENALKSDQEKLMDVLEGYKERKHQIGRVALENCADENIALQECYESGSIAERLLLCRQQKKAYNRCYLMQSQFLKALGYLSSFDRPAEVDEQIQMHADTLYHRMLAQEKAIQEAKAAGQPVPDFDAVDQPEDQTASATKAQGAQSEELPPLSAELTQKLKPETQLEFRKKLKGLTPAERQIEESSKLADYEADWQVAKEVHRLRSSAGAERRKRREEGKETAADTVSGWFGW